MFEHGALLDAALPPLLDFGTRHLHQAEHGRREYAMMMHRRPFNRLASRAVLAALASPALLPAAALARRRRWEGTEDWGASSDNPWSATRRPSPFRMSDVEVVEAFLEAALGHPKGSQAESLAQRFVPWRGPIRTLVFGQVGAEQVRLAEATLAWCRMATGLAVTPPGNGAANLAILFSDQPREDLAGPLWERAGAALFASPEALRDVLGEAGPCFALAPAGRGIGLIAVPTALVGGGLACLPRMLMGILGLKGRLGLSVPSILSASGIAKEPTPLDRLLAALATDPALPSGMDQAALRQAVPALLPRHRPWAGFDPLAEEQPDSAPTAPSTIFDPDAGRALRAFEAMALPAGAVPAHLLRWPARAEVPIHVLGSAPASAFDALRWTMGWAAAASQLRLRFAETRREEGITLMLGETLEGMWEEYGPSIAVYFGNDHGRFEAMIRGPAATADHAQTLQHFTVPGGVLVRTLSLVATGGNPDLLSRRIGCEFLRALGLRGDAAGIGHSLLDRTIPALQPSALDDRVLRLTYAEAMRPGMARDVASLAAARLLGLAPQATDDAAAEAP